MNPPSALWQKGDSLNFGLVEQITQRTFLKKSPQFVDKFIDKLKGCRNQLRQPFYICDQNKSDRWKTMVMIR